MNKFNNELIVKVDIKSEDKSITNKIKYDLLDIDGCMQITVSKINILWCEFNKSDINTIADELKIISRNNKTKIIYSFYDSDDNQLFPK